MKLKPIIIGTLFASVWSTPLHAVDVTNQATTIQKTTASELIAKQQSRSKVDGASSATKSSTCSISGRVYGLEQQRGRKFSILVIDRRNDRAIARFPLSSNASYRINLKSSGRYLLRVVRSSAGSVFPVPTNPSQRIVKCNEGTQVRNADFALG